MTTRAPGPVTTRSGPAAPPAATAITSGALAILALDLPGAVRPGLLILLAAGLAALCVVGPHRAAAAGVVVLGTIGLAVGLAVGGRHLAAGPPAPVALGVAAAGGGLFLLVASIRSHLRHSRGAQRWLLLPVALGVVFAGYAIVPAVVAVSPAPTPLRSSTPADLGLPYRSVQIRADHSVLLSAWWLPSLGGAAVVTLHGSGSNRSATLPQAAVLARHGYGVLLLDARGHGASGGPGMDFGWYSEADVSAAVSWLALEPGVDARRIGLLGLSMGGEGAIGAAAADGRVRAVVAEGVTGRTAADKAAWLPGGLTGVLQRAADQVTFGLAGMLSGAPRPMPLTTAVRRMAPRPLLLVAAGSVPDESLAADAVRSASPASVSVWVVPGAGHTAGLAARPAEWQQRVVGFLDRSLAAD